MKLKNSVKRTVLKSTVLENHKIYIYEFNSPDEAIEKLNLLNRYKRVVKKKNKDFKFIVSIDFKGKPKVTLEVWTFPLSFLN